MFVLMYQTTIQYLLLFMLDSQELASLVGYTANQHEWHKYKVVIVPSPFFEDHQQGRVQLPSLPLTSLEGMPILFGEPQVKQVNGTTVIYADLVASALFLLSRYEEKLNPERDVHNRFPAKASLAYKAGFLQRPLVDEYGAYLRKCLAQCGVELTQNAPKMTITLTHDVDVPFEHRTLRSFLGGIRRGKVKTALKNACSSLDKNSVYTFPWLLEQDNRLPEAQKIYFLRYPIQACAYDKPYLSYRMRDMKQLVTLLKQNGVQLGLHGSYQSGADGSLIVEEKRQLEKNIGTPLTQHRYHFLRTCIPDNFISLQEAGILHDYTVGYADAVGFRLGTCHPVRFLSPVTLQVENVQLHPLTMMDVTLSDYRQLSYRQAWETIVQLIEQVKKHHGELVLLWHNTSVADATSYHRQLYNDIITHLTLD